MRRRSRWVKLTILPALATACATAPIVDDDELRMERSMRGSEPPAYGVAYEGADPPPEGLPVEVPDDEGVAPPYGYGGARSFGGFQVGGFGHFFGGHFGG